MKLQLHQSHVQDAKKKSSEYGLLTPILIYAKIKRSESF